MMDLLDMLELTPSEDREFSRMNKAMQDARAWLDEPGLRRLAHPVRLAAVPAMSPNITLATMCEPRNQPKLREHLVNRMSTIDIFLEMQRAKDRRQHIFHSINTSVAEQSGAYGNGAAGATTQGMRFGFAGGQIYTFTDELVQLLHKTKLGTDIPVSELKLPTPNIYIELGTNRDEPLMWLRNQESGLHALEGAYISSVVDSSGNECLEVTLTGSPNGRDDLMDDAIEWSSMRTSGHVSIATALEEAFTKAVDANGEVIAVADEAVVAARARDTLPKLELIAKCILFLGLPDAVKNTMLEGTEARKALARAQSGAHRRKASKVAARSYDRVVVDAPPAPTLHAEGAAEGTPGQKSFHWRDGHLRHQRHGPGNTLTKVIWIRPMPIRVDRLAAE